LEGLRIENAGGFYDHLEYFTAIWTILRPLGNVVMFSRFGILCQEKSGNPDCEAFFRRKKAWVEGQTRDLSVVVYFLLPRATICEPGKEVSHLGTNFCAWV
jgi:hypothetical protein